MAQSNGKERAPRDEDYFIELAFRKSGRQRFTQDSPVLADVVVHYGMRPQKTLDLLLTPDWSKTPDLVADELSMWLDTGRPEAGASVPEDHEIAYNQSVVAARLGFEELIETVLPLSWWWQNRLIASPGLDPVRAIRGAARRRVRAELLAGLEVEIGGEEWRERDRSHWLIRQDLVWAARLFYVVSHSNRRRGGKRIRDASDSDSEEITAYFFRLVDRVAARQDAVEAAVGKPPPSAPWVYSVNRNRTIDRAVLDSVGTTKADAARRTFDIGGDGIRWAVIDTGIDARHLGFRKLDAEGRPFKHAFGEDGENYTRIKATYDFSDVRKHLSLESRRKVKSGRLLDRAEAESIAGVLQIQHTREHYRTPVLSHGTHVAGILGADWRPDEDTVDPLGPPPNARAPREPLTGLCPEIELYDLRVFRDDGKGDEFAVMSALQFVRGLNQYYDNLEIHGVNLSLAMAHEVSNYACGRSPVCEECTRLVGNGVVVVAAAGNAGRSVFTTPQGLRDEGYRVVSIADPGNTEAAITVGATHRKAPHNYGVSYFSSRGPTGDGRAKPDLVAPGEKILSTVPGNASTREDGTSQAAPHVSGAAALLMSRHRELIGQPRRIKEILMETATDLGREKDYQGAGLVDVMRAIQRV